MEGTPALCLGGAGEKLERFYGRGQGAVAQHSALNPNGQRRIGEDFALKCDGMHPLEGSLIHASLAATALLDIIRQPDGV